MVHIKRLEIRGFKSYKDQTMFEPFSEHQNVVVGRNGAGKSNFFAGEEGSGSTVTQAYVEIVFDNSDGRFPIDNSEVVIRRTIGLKKDEYFLDSKHVMKTEIGNLLESAGFSRSNPYYIVQQGKVKELTMMKDAARLELLKEVAGTRVYDERREQVLKIMEEAGGKVTKVKDLLEYIIQRLAELEEEKQELVEFEKLDKQRRGIEYTIHDKDLASTRKELEQLETKRRDDIEHSSQAQAELSKAREQVKDTEHEIKKRKTEIANLLRDQAAASDERQELIRVRAKLELDIKDVEDNEQTVEERKRTLEKEGKTLAKEIDSRRSALAKTEPQYIEASRRLTDLERDLANSERRIAELYAKQGRKQQFKDAKSRDTWINKQVSEIQSTLKVHQKKLVEITADITKISTSVAQLENSVAEKSKQIEARQNDLVKRDQELSGKYKERDDLQETRRDLWQKDTTYQREADVIRQDVIKFEKLLQNSVPRALSNGLNAVSNIVARHKITGVYGPLIQLISCPDKFSTAVEVTAGNSLFHVVVDTDDTAARIVEILQRENGGRVTFIPLNRVQVKPQAYPQSEDVLPLVSKIQYQPSIEAAVKQVFGKTLLARDLKVAGEVARSSDFNCVTMEGDQVSRRGAMTGGFHDTKVSRMDAQAKLSNARNELQNNEQESKKTKSGIENVEQNVTRVLSEIAKLENHRDGARDQLESLRMELKSATRDLETRRQVLDDMRKTQEGYQQTIATLHSDIAALQSELDSELTSQLNTNEQDELSDLHETIERLKQEVIAATKTKSKVHAEYRELQTVLKDNLERRQLDLEEELGQLQVAGRTEDITRKQHELDALERSLTALQERIKRTSEEVKHKSDEVKHLEDQRERLRKEEADVQKRLQSESKDVERIFLQRATLMRRRDDLVKKTRDIGSIPEGMDKFASLSVQKLMEKLHTVNEQLKKYVHVNKKALDQYVSFQEQKRDLESRLGEVTSGQHSIDDLVATLDQRKDEAIVRTFRQVSKHFKEVFRELVPHGSANLVMLRDDQEIASKEGNVSTFTGVSFTGDSGESQLMHQLSGGQKSVVALALIFAIQRCDPAPFYLFDEIDSALDAAHRTAVAAVVQKQAENAQFIITTFRPELVQHASKCYCVTNDHKVSQISVISTADALSLIAEEEQRAAEERPSTAD